MQAEPAPALSSAPVETPADAPGVTLERLLDYADEHAPALRVAASRRRLGAAAREGALPLLRENPTLQLSAGPRFEEGRRETELELELSQPLELAGQRGLRRAAAERLGERLQADVELARRELRRQITTCYQDAVVARERDQIAQSVVAFADELLRITERRLKAGEVSSIDVRLAQGDLAEARQLQVLARQSGMQARLALSELTGWPLDTPPRPSAALEPPSPVPALDPLLTRAGERHPELRVRQAASAEAHARARLADREAWPSPSVGVSVTRESHAPGPSYVVLGSVALPLPLWQRNQAERALARADEDVARAEQAATALQLRARIARAHSVLATAAERLQIMTSLITPSLEDSLSLLRRGFDAGELPLTLVAVARERFLQTRLHALDIYADYYRARAELEFLAGDERAGAAQRAP